ncbi:caspase family protein [Rhodobacteraceae bacterium F11138]|nr:caspase family protein [Rhodobacteraceae bacterium F11138]
MRAFLIVFWLSVLPIAGWGGNVALVIGNSSYQTVPSLPNPANDANAVARVLQQQGFQVTTAIDMTRAQMLSTLRAFRGQADDADVAMVYYAGHGMEISGRNYLIPIDARIADERDARLEMIEMGDVLAQLSGARQMKMIVLDACRDNPFVARMQRDQTARNVGRGLAIVKDAGADTLIAYAAAAGEVTPDGLEGGNSPFTRAFLNAFQGPPTDVRLLLGHVRDELRQSVPGAAPFVYSSLGGAQYILNANSPPTPPAANLVPALDENTLLIDFATAEISNSADAWNTFLTKYAAYSDHTLFILGRRNRDQLAAGAVAASAPSEPRSGTPAAPSEQVAALSAPVPPPDTVEPAAPEMTRKAAILEIQKLLKQRNCYAGRLDGLYGRQTARGLATLSTRSGAALSVRKSSTVRDLQDVISRLVIIDDVKCPTAKVARRPAAPANKPRPAATAKPPAPVVAAPAPAPAPAPAKKKRPQPGSTVFKNPPNYCPQYGSSKGCRDGTPTDW